MDMANGGSYSHRCWVKGRMGLAQLGDTMVYEAKGARHER